MDRTSHVCADDGFGLDPFQPRAQTSLARTFGIATAERAFASGRQMEAA